MSLKLAYCIPSLHCVGGMERTLTIKANYLADHLDYQVWIITTDGKEHEPAFKLSEKVVVVNLDLNYDKIWGQNLLKKTFNYLQKQRLFKKRLEKTLLEIKPDITISMLRRDINFIGKLKDGSIKVGECHSNRDNFRDLNNAKSTNYIKKGLSKLWMNQLISNLKKIDKFVVLSYEDRAKWPEIEDVSVIYNPLPFFPENTSDCKSKTVVTAGRFAYQKGFDLLLKAWPKVSKVHPDWTLTVYGAGEKTMYQRIIDELSISETCKLLDPVINLNEKLTESSIFAFSSRFEGFGMVITEAMVCGLPVVAFACPCGPKDIIEDGENGYLVEVGDLDAFAEKICQLIEDPELRIKIGRQARIDSEKFRIENIANQWDSLFKSLVAYKS